MRKGKSGILGVILLIIILGGGYYLYRDYSWYLFPQEFEGEPEPPLNASGLELLAHDLVNQERTSRGLGELKWNQRVAEVARAHSRDMGLNSYFSHEDLGGGFHDDRLMAGEIYYFNLSGENLGKGSIVVSETVNVLGEVVSREYRTEEEMARTIVDGWMNSTLHRENMLKPEYGEAGMGVALASDQETYYFTQVFITRVDCGYETGPCCVKLGYLPSCFVGLKCENGICAG